MASDIVVPPFPESVTDGTVVAWRKQPGDAVRRGDIVADIETDKVVFEVPAAEDGALAEVLAPVGTAVVAGQVIGRLGAGSGEALARVPVAGAKPAVAPPVRPAATTAVLPEAAFAGRAEKRVPLSRLRARIAERLKEAQNTAAILTTFNEVNMAPVMALRARYRESFEKEYGVRLGFMSFFVKACVEALKRFPEVNASIDGNDVVYHGFYDIGIAVSSPRGLVVPILHDADRLSVARIEAAIKDYAERAKEGKLKLEELTGGTFSITNGGVFGSLLSTPILNPPQSAILGMHKTQERPVAENGQVVIRPMMYLALSYDHRLVDGREAVQFLVTVKEALEDPARLLLEI